MNARWTPLRSHPVQQAYWRSPHRFNVVPAGRRSGKTEIGKRRLVYRCLRATTTWAPSYFAAAPTRDQAKRIFWEDLKLLVGKDMMRDHSETELTIWTKTGGKLVVVGLDKPERIEGSPWDGGLITEMGNTKPTAWKMNIRPALSDRNGWCDLEGVPEGRNHYYDINLSALAELAEKGMSSQWGHFTWPSRDILPPEEIEAAMRDLDELTFDQEYNASFINFSGRAYYAFNTKDHCKPLRYDPKAPLALCFDFNVEPGVCAIVQEQPLPGQYEREPFPPLKPGMPPRPNPQGALRMDLPLMGTGVIGEVYIPRNSNTPAVCRAVLSNRDGTPTKWAQHQGQVTCYGDATGGARGTAKVQGSDWDLIRKELQPTYKERFAMCVKESNPAERSRVNAVNSRLRNMWGDVRLMIDPKAAPWTVKDFDGVILLEGGSGEIDKKHNPALTHLTDGVGYYVEYRYPVSGPGIAKGQLAGH